MRSKTDLHNAAQEQMVEEIRKQRSTMQVLILSAKASVDDRVKGLQSGSDDYLGKPFAFGELLARVQALVRRGLLHHVFCAKAGHRLAAGAVDVHDVFGENVLILGKHEPKTK